MGLVLASGSPRRRDLLRRAGFEFEVRPVDVDETPPSGLPSREVVSLVAERKARAAAEVGPGTILAADTVVVVDGRLLGKPADREDALRMIEALSGRTHEVLTGVVLLPAAAGRISRRVVVTEVTFREIGAEEARTYAASADCLDKAGAYGIQAEGRRFVTRIRGPEDNVVGLPMEAVLEMLG